MYWLMVMPGGSIDHQFCLLPAYFGDSCVPPAQSFGSTAPCVIIIINIIILLTKHL